MIPDKKFRLILATVSALLLVSSFFFPAFANDSNDGIEISDSLMLFFLGWMTALGGAWEVVFWVANPLLVIAIVRLYLNRTGVYKLSAIAFLIAAGFFFLPDITASEAGGRADILWLGAGYWLWISSMFVLMAGIFAYKRILSKK